ncbi:MAG: protein-glutamate O-methyltransferase [Neomegalonema sp.]|nr:protein-glutamate O-methyltransferase [Neomegalonema sp.]
MMQDLSSQTDKGGGGAATFTPMSDAEFREFSKIVLDLTGIVIQAHKRQMITSRLSRRLRAKGMGSFSDYLEFVTSERGATEHEEFVNAVTTNLTSFFRESHHFDHFAEAVIKPFVAARGTKMRVWSSAASSGEEPYSIAMTALAASGGHLPRDFKILATDLDTRMLTRCREGVYTSERGEKLPPMAAPYVERSGDQISVKQQAKALITFNQLNLLHDWPMKGPFDVIFCRNVLIYFDLATKRSIVDRLTKLIRPQGFLYLGHSEAMLGEHPELRSQGKTIFQKVPR